MPRSAFPIAEGAGGAGTGSYESGLLTLSDGATRGVEEITRLTARDEGARRPAVRAIPGFLGSLRSVLPAAGGLPMPARLAVSTVRAGLGVIEEGFAPEGVDPVSVELAFGDGATIVARMPPGMVAVIRRDREIALGTLARAARAPGAPLETVQTVPLAEGTTEALTSIFRYEKRNGRLRRIAEPDPSAKE